MEGIVLRVNEPKEDWAEVFVFSVEPTSPDDCALEAFGKTYAEAAQWAKAALTMRADQILKRYNLLMNECDELLIRGKAAVDKAKEIEEQWPDTE